MGLRAAWRAVWNTDPHTTSGLQTPEPPPQGANRIDAAMYYIRYYDEELGRSRLVVKRRSRNAMLATGFGNGALGVVGAVFAVSGWRWLGVVTAGIAAAIALVGQWDRHFRHTEHWRERSKTLAKVQALHRRAELDAIGASNPDQLAGEFMDELNKLLAVDGDSWQRLHRDPAPRAHPNQHVS